MITDEEAIRRTLVEYCFLLDSGDWDEWAELYEPDAVFAVPAAGTEVRGRDAIRRWMSETYHWVDVGRHVVVNPVVTVEGDQATVVSEVVFFMSTDDGPRAGLIGRYHDILRQTDAWRFARRESDIHESWMAPSLRQTLTATRSAASARTGQ